MNFKTPPNLQGEKIRILMIGCGGTGSELLKLLIKTQVAIRKLAPQNSGIELTLYDGDYVADSNIGRQNYYENDQGYNKAELSIGRINVWHGFNWKAKASYYDPENISSDQHKYDLIITCTDSAKFRASLGKFGKDIKRNLLWLDAGNGQFTGQVIIGHIGKVGTKDQRLPNVYDLYPSLDDALEDDEPSCSLAEALSKQDLMVNMTAAMWMNNFLWQLIRHGGINDHGIYFNLRKGLCLPIKINQSVWASMGYIAEQTML